MFEAPNYHQLSIIVFKIGHVRSKGELLRGKFGGTRNAGLEGTVDIQLTQLQGQFTCLSSFFSRHSSRSRDSWRALNTIRITFHTKITKSHEKNWTSNSSYKYHLAWCSRCAIFAKRSLRELKYYLITIIYFSDKFDSEQVNSWFQNSL